LKTAAIIAEYNPFHAGHAYLTARCRAYGATHVAAIMNGHFMQRGEPSLLSKWARAKSALSCGVDLVVELPLSFGSACAERFALGGVALADAMGCADMLAFGCECDDIALLIEASEAVADPQVMTRIKSLAAEGKSFPRAREEAIRKFYSGEIAELLDKPNNILAIEYLKALRQLGSDIAPLPVMRKGSAHDGKIPKDGILSAGAIRGFGSPEQARGFMPDAAYEIYKNECDSGAITDRGKIETAVLSKLRTMTAEDFRELPDVSEGLEHRIYSAMRQATGLGELYDAVKTKRYTHSRIRRIIMHAFLGVTRELLPASPSYMRVLGHNEKGRELLSLLKKNAKLPLCAKASELKGNPDFELECRASDLYSLLLKKTEVCGREMTQQIIII